MKRPFATAVEHFPKRDADLVVSVRAARWRRCGNRPGLFERPGGRGFGGRLGFHAALLHGNWERGVRNHIREALLPNVTPVGLAIGRHCGKWLRNYPIAMSRDALASLFSALYFGTGRVFRAALQPAMVFYGTEKHLESAGAGGGSGGGLFRKRKPALDPHR